MEAIIFYVKEQHMKSNKILMLSVIENIQIASC